MTDPIRLPLAHNLTPRSATADKDALVSNVFYDKNTKGDIFAVKRPGVTSYISGSGSGIGMHGGFSWNALQLWYDSVWNGEKFCAVSGSDVLQQGYNNIVITSTDGISWEQGFMPSESEWTGITWNGTVFCAVGYDEYTTSGEGKIATSPDGINWTSRFSTYPTAHPLYKIATNGSDLVAISRSASVSAGTAYYSVDNGLNWTQGNLTGIAGVGGFWSDIAYCSGAGLYCSVYGLISDSNRTEYATSPTGASWTKRTITSARRLSICASNTKFFSPRYDSDKGDISTDGINWTEVTLPSTRNWYDCSWTGSHFIALGSVGTEYAIAYSQDAVVWSEVLLPTALNIYSVYNMIGGNTSSIFALGYGNSYSYSQDDGLSYSLSDLQRWFPIPYTTY